jgi:23S rRNA (cytosine1962-C5)-methyltransferase
MTDMKREVAKWDSYELLDSGDGQKLERFGEFTMVRPDPLAIWRPNGPQAWKNADLTFVRKGEEGSWTYARRPDAHWDVSYGDFRFSLKPTSFKHVGVFPEQAPNWEWMRHQLKPKDSVLNLFAYTGGATLAAAAAGASVVHLDASKPVVEWAKENARASGLEDRPVRWLYDDAMKFLMREVRRKNTYDLIVLDPPAFGHGPKNELWMFDRDFPGLLDLCAQLVNQEKGALLVNAYSMGYPLLAIEQAIRAAMPFAKKFEAIELVLEESTPRKFGLPTGVAVRASW